MTTTLLQLCKFKLCLVSGKRGILERLLRLRILSAVVLVFQVELLLQLVYFDLEFDATFSFKVICLEELHLKRITFLAQPLSFLAKFSFCLLCLQQLHLQFAHLFFEQIDTLAQQRFSSLLILSILTQLL